MSAPVEGALPEHLVEAARRWRTLDPDNAQAIDELLASGDAGALELAFGATLDFGTGGMRGPLGPGTNRMNRPMVRRVTAALADALVARWPDAQERGVVLAGDARWGSASFVRDAAGVLVARGFVVHLADGVVPTPIVAFATPALGAVAGIMVTASHNPREDNGYKVFGAEGAQIVPPFDEAVRAGMEHVAEPVSVGEGPGRVMPWPEGLLDGYLRRVLAERVHGPGPLRIAYTPVHGVGGELALRALRAAGYDDVHVVFEQFTPDGAFPTVDFPNPEEPGVLDRALALGTSVGADLVLANDPDADRLAVAVPGPNGWRVLTGNETGVLLAEDLLTAGGAQPTDLVATTLVSTGLLARVARARGVRYAETLTGFKWIAGAALAAEREGARFRFGFEESIGYTVGTVVRDKDGISAAVLVADLAAHAKASGRSLLDLLEALWREHGLHVGQQVSIRAPGLDGLARMRGAMAGLRARLPVSLGGREVLAVRDVAQGTVRTRDGAISALDLPRSDVLGFDLEGARALVRPSGTEPKIKLYVEVVEPCAGEPLDGARVRAEAAAQRIVDDLRARLGL